MNANQRFLLLIRAAAVDGRVSADESELLLLIAPRLGIDRDAAPALIEEVARGGRVSLDTGARPRERERILEDILGVARADGTIHARERAMLERVARAFAFADGTVDRVLAGEPIVVEGFVPPPAPRGGGAGRATTLFVLLDGTSIIFAFAIVGAILAAMGAFLLASGPGDMATFALGQTATGALLVLPALVAWWRLARLLGHGEASVATVVGLRTPPPSRNNRRPRPRVGYAYRRGDVDARGGFSAWSRRPAIDVGDRIWVIVDRARPGRSAPWNVF